MLLLDWQLTLLALVLLPIFIIPAKRVGRRLQAITREGMDLNSAMNTQMTERFNVSGALLVKLFGSGTREIDEFGARAGRVRDIGVRSAMYGRTFFVALGLVAAVGTAAVYWVGGQLVISGTLSIGTLVAMAAYVTRIYTPLTSLTNARVDIMTAFVSFDRVFEVLDTPNPITDRPGAVDLVDPSGSIEFDELWFRYPAASEVSLASLEADTTAALSDEAGAFVLRGIDAEIEPGQLVALVGPSGAGKTTLTGLVPRLYDVTEGAVRIDGHDVRDLTQDTLRAAIGVVSQDPHLFHDTVLDNLRYARPEATDDEVSRRLPCRPDPRRHRGAARGLRHGRRRARSPTVRRREATPRHRPHAAEEPVRRRSSTKPRVISTPRTRRSCRRRSPPRSRTARRS